MFATGKAPDASSDLPLALLERQICSLAADINAATCRWLAMLAEFDRRAGFERAGFHSCAGWLAWHCSLTARAAREHCRVARRLVELPAIAGAFAEGELSYSKVRALTRVASADLEPELLEVARHATAEQLERVVSGLRRALAGDEAELACERRHLSLRWEAEGMLRVAGLLPAEEGELLIRAIEAAREALRREGGIASKPDRADGLNALAESLLAQGPVAAPGGERNQVVVHVDLDRLAAPPGAPHPEVSSTARVGAGGAIGAGTAQRLACDASVVTLVERAGEPVSVGRKTRAVPPAIQRALRTRDRGCAFPGCGHERYVDAHHIHHWAAGGETALSNLVMLCRRHHRLVHEGGFAIEGDARSGLRFLRPDGAEVGARAPVAPQALPPAPKPLHAGAGDALDLDHVLLLLGEQRRAPEPVDVG